MGNIAHPEPMKQQHLSYFKRYKYLTLSVVVFLLFVLAIMYTTVQLATHIQNNQAKMEQVSRLNDAMHNLFGEGQALHVSALAGAYRLEKVGDAQLMYLDELAERQKQLANKESEWKTLLAAQAGDVDVQAINELWQTQQPLVQKATNSEWASAYLRLALATGGLSNVSDKDQANLLSGYREWLQGFDVFSHQTQTEFSTAINQLTQHLNADTQQQMVLLRWVQIIGISVSVLYFLFFIYFLMRRLTQAAEVAETARRETDEIMQTVHHGLFLLDKELNIGSQYSKELERLLGKTHLGGKNLLDVLADMIARPEDLDVAASFVRQLYNPRTKERLIASLNPLVRTPIQITTEAGEETRYLDFSFHRVYHDKEISRVLVNVSDVTNAVLLEEKVQQERGYNDWHVEIISSILKVDPLLMGDFIVYTKQRNRKINEKLKEPVRVQDDFADKLQYIAREVHGLKGDASSLNLQSFILLAENLEITLKTLKEKSYLTGEDFLPLTVSLEELFSLTQTIDDLNRRITGKGNHEQAISTKTEPIKKQIVKFVTELAQRHGKDVDLGCVGMDNPALNVNLKSNLREIAVQLLRNAVVHGIEVPEVRSERNKLATGHIRVEMQEEEDFVRLLVQDDGNGIDFDQIRQKLIDKGEYTPDAAAQLDANALVQYIFVHGFSTQDSSSEDAGRGVGMDMVHERVKKMNGKLAVATRTGAYTSVTVTVPRKF